MVDRKNTTGLGSRPSVSSESHNWHTGKLSPHYLLILTFLSPRISQYACIVTAVSTSMFFLTNRMWCVTIASSILCHCSIVYCDPYLLSGKTKIVIFCRPLKSIAILTLPPGTCRSALRNTVNDVKNSLSLSYFLLYFPYLPSSVFAGREHQDWDRMPWLLIVIGVAQYRWKLDSVSTLLMLFWSIYVLFWLVWEC